MNEVFLNNLFKYYDLTLKIDNILGISLKEKSLSQYGLIDYNEKTTESNRIRFAVNMFMIVEILMMVLIMKMFLFTINQKKIY